MSATADLLAVIANLPAGEVVLDVGQGPGFLATLQLSSALPAESLLERFYVKPEASLYGDFIDPVDGFFRMPDGPGLGLDPDPEVVKAYRKQEE